MLYLTGVIILYKLYHNGLLVFNDSILRSVTFNNLQPYSFHSFRIEVCTIMGCASSGVVVGNTQEAPPVGSVGLNLKVAGSRSVQVQWSAVTASNGLLYYDVYFDGLYYVNTGTQIG